MNSKSRIRVRPSFVMTRVKGLSPCDVTDHLVMKPVFGKNPSLGSDQRNTICPTGCGGVLTRLATLHGIKDHITRDNTCTGAVQSLLVEQGSLDRCVSPDMIRDSDKTNKYLLIL